MSINEFKEELTKYLDWVKGPSKQLSEEKILKLASDFNDKREILWDKLYSKYGMPDYILVIEYELKDDNDSKYTCVDYEPFTLEDYNKISIYIDFSGVLDKTYFSLLDKNDNNSEDSSIYKVYTNIYITENIKKKLNNYFNKD